MARKISFRSLFGICGALLLVAAGLQDRRGPRFEVLPAFTPPEDAPKFAADRVLVKFTGTLLPAQIDRMVAPLGARWLESGEGRAFEVLTVPAGDVQKWVALLNGLPGVEYAEPDFVAWKSSTPNDSYFFPYQWNFYDYGTLSNGYASNYGVQGMTTWNTTTGTGVTVAIVDTGVAYENHNRFSVAPDLVGTTFVAPKDYVHGDTHANDDNGHGTHVCGTVRQATNNATGCAGLAYSCKIMPVKVLDASGSGYYSWIASGIRWAADNGAFAINLSLGGTTGAQTLKDAVDYAWGKGCVICAASGNGGTGSVDYPARYANCIAVGATRFDGARASYSNYGSDLDVVAPGGDASVDQNHDGYGDGILQQTFSNNVSTFNYYFFTGTSMATPHVTAIAALVKANKSGYTNTQVRDAIQNTCKDLGAAGKDTTFGFGLVNAAAAINY